MHLTRHISRLALFFKSESKCEFLAATGRYILVSLKGKCAIGDMFSRSFSQLCVFRAFSRSHVSLWIQNMFFYAFYQFNKLIN